MSAEFEPMHLSAQPGDFAGNDGRGRYILVPGSNHRAARIAERFTTLDTVRRHKRGHDVYLGTLTGAHGPIDVAVVSTGMGAPSAEIIITELFELGGRRFLRVGTSGTMQPGQVLPGEYVAVTAAVRDEGASRCYAPLEFPAVAAPEWVVAVGQAAEALSLRCHAGVVHSKDAFYAREFGYGPLADDHARYRALLTSFGVLASEMEASLLFTLGSVFGQTLRATGEKVLMGAALTILGETHEYTDMAAQKDEAVNGLIELGLEAVRRLDAIER
jgi:uridine phosphorylase